MNIIEREKLRNRRAAKKEFFKLMKLELFHIAGRLIAGSGVLLVGKYILNIWG